MKFSSFDGEQKFSSKFSLEDFVQAIPELDLKLSTENLSDSSGSPLPPRVHRDRGAFFSVSLPKEYGPMHIARLLLTAVIDGDVKDTEAILILYEVTDRILHTAACKREFRKKWRTQIQVLVYLCQKVYPRIQKNQYKLSIVRYLLRNGIEQYLPLSKFLIPPRTRKDKILDDVKIVRHLKYTPPPKKSTKIPSNSAGTKGNYQPDSISWKEVASQEKIWENGKFVRVFEMNNPDPGKVEN